MRSCKAHQPSSLVIPSPFIRRKSEGEALATGWNVPSGASLKDLRAISAANILKVQPDHIRHVPGASPSTVMLFARAPAEVFRTGQTHQVPLLLGNSAREPIPNTPPPTGLEKGNRRSVWTTCRARAFTLHTAELIRYMAPQRISG